MKYLRVFDTEADYLAVKDSLVYPTLSYTKNTNKVWSKDRPIPNRIIATYSVTEEQVGQDVLLATNVGNCSDIILDGKSLNTPISIIGSGVVTPTSYGIYSDMTFTDDSWVVSPSAPWVITFDKPLQAGDMIGMSLFVPEYNVGENVFMAYEELVSQGLLIPIEPNNAQKFTCIYTTAVVGIDCNFLMYAFTPIDDDGTVTEDNFIGATHESKSGGVPSHVVVTPTEATTYIVEYRLPKENASKTIIQNISKNATSVDLSSCDASNVTDMSWMFNGCSGLTSVTFGENFDTSNVTNMSALFYHCTSLTSLDLSSFDTSKVTDMSRMFDSCSGLTSVTMNSNISSLTNVTDMFYGIATEGQFIYDESKDYTLILDVLPPLWNDNIITATYSLSNSGSTIIINDITALRNGIMVVDGKYINASTSYSFSTSGQHVVQYGMKYSTQSMAGLFSDCTYLTSIEVNNSKLPHLTDVSKMFYYCGSLTSLDLSNFNTSNVTNMYWMFAYCYNLTSVTFGDTFDTSNVTDMTRMFYGCGSLTSLDLSNFNTSNVTNMGEMFSNCSGLASLDLSNFNTSKVTSMGYMFNQCSGLTSVTFGDNFDTSKVTSMGGMFYCCDSLTSLDLSNFDTSNVRYMTNMFMGCDKLTSLDLSSFDTSNVTDMTKMFYDCDSLTSITLGENFDTSKVTSMGYMFDGCHDLTSIDLSSCDTSNVTNMSCMFSGCSSLTSITFGENFDTSNVTSMNGMFSSCSCLTSLDLSSFDTSNVTDMKWMFYDCRGLTSLDVSNFDTSNVTNMNYMFYGCSGLTSIDVSNFNTSKVTNMESMFSHCENLTSVTFGSQADVSKVSSYGWMFASITTTGTLYYPSAYATAWNNLLVTNQSTSKFPSTWTAVPIDYENGETAPTV